MGRGLELKNQAERLTNDALKGLAAQLEIADNIVAILVGEPDSLAKDPILSLAVLRYIANRNSMVELADRAENAGLLDGAEGKIEDILKRLEEEGDDS